MNDQNTMPQSDDQKQILQWLEMRQTLQQCLIRFARIQEVQEMEIAVHPANKEATASPVEMS